MLIQGKTGDEEDPIRVKQSELGRSPDGPRPQRLDCKVRVEVTANREFILGGDRDPTFTKGKNCSNCL